MDHSTPQKHHESLSVGQLHRKFFFEEKLSVEQITRKLGGGGGNLINLVEQSSDRTTLGKQIGHSETQAKQYFFYYLRFLRKKLLLYRFKKDVELVTTVFFAFLFKCLGLVIIRCKIPDYQQSELLHPQDSRHWTVKGPSNSKKDTQK